MKYRSFLIKVIRIRKMLLKTERNHRNKMAVTCDVEFLERHMAANTYTEDQWKYFFQRHAEKIYNIIPGNGCKSHEKLLTEFNTIKSL